MVEGILQWRETLSTLPDYHFFEIIRMYLGEVKTPYNKQKFIEELSAFLRKEENKQNIIKLLTPVDLDILTIISLIPEASQEKLTSFFAGQYTFTVLYEKLMNLEERLLLYRYIDPKVRKMVFAINPLLRSSLEPLLSECRVLSKTTSIETNDTLEQNILPLSPGLLAAFFSFISENPDLCKADGSFKKRIEQDIPVRFIGCSDIRLFQLFITALANLNLIRLTDTGYSTRITRWKMFAKLPECIQYAYIVTASCGYVPRDMLQGKTQILLDILTGIPENGFTKTALLREAFILQERSISSSILIRENRFASIINQARVTDTKFSETQITMENLINNAINFGLLKAIGQTRDKEMVYNVAISLNMENVTQKKFASIDSSFLTTIMPGAGLSDLLSFAQCMQLVRYDTVLQFEVTRSAVIRCFDAGEEPKNLLVDIERCTTHELPQNMVFSFNDWYLGYNSAAMFKGYVLRIIPEKAILVEKNPEFLPYIKMNLAPGVYLMDFASDVEASSVISNSGLDFIGSVRDLHAENDVLPFPSVNLRGKPTWFNKKNEISNEINVVPLSEKEEEQFIDSLKKKLFDMELPKDQEDELLARIQRRIIVNSSQLRGDSVRPEKNEASGMDFLGKTHVIEHAITSDSLIEIIYNNITYLCHPMGIEKQNSETYVKLKIEPDKIDKLFSIGQIQLVKRIRGPIFKEPGYDS